MNRDLDEIEAELGKESMKDIYLGSQVICNDGKRGKVTYVYPLKDCEVESCFEVDRGVDGSETYFQWQVKCIPVEPERVKEDAFPQWHPPCGFQGLCHNGWGSKWCAECPWFDKAPSPGLLQRMGMCTWPSEARDWFVISQFWPSIHSRTEEQARDECRVSGLRMFRWSQGVQG